MKTKLLLMIFLTLSATNLIIAQKNTDVTRAGDLNLFAGYGNLGAAFEGDWRIFLSEKKPIGTKIYLNFGFQSQKFDSAYFRFGTPGNFKEYSSDTRIVMYGLGLSEDYYVSPKFTLGGFIGMRFESSKLKDSYINDQVRGGQFIRYLGGVEVGKRLDDSYGSSELAIDIGGYACVNLSKKFWLKLKGGLCKIYYASDNSLYGQYWANTNYKNNYYINRPIARAEISLGLSF